MLRDVQIYLIVQDGQGDVSVTVSRDVSEAQRAWEVRLAADADSAALVHAGYGRPKTEEFASLLETNPGRVLVTEAARWLLPPSCSEASWPCGATAEAGGRRPMGIYLATKGWGYDMVDPTAPPDPAGSAPEAALSNVFDPVAERSAFAERLRSVDLSDVTAVAGALPGWLLRAPIGVLDVDARSQNILRDRGLLTVGDLAEVRRADMSGWHGFGPTSRDNVAHSLVQAAMDRGLEAQFGAISPASPPPGYQSHPSDPDDVGSVLRGVPAWMDAVPLSRVDLTVRCTNVLRKVGAARVGDLKGYTTEAMLRWRNFGRTSVRDLSETLIAASADPVLIAEFSQTDPSLPDPAPPGDGGPHTEQGGADDSALRPGLTLVGVLDAILHGLPERSSAIFNRRTGRDGTALQVQLEALGAELGLTRERVRQIEAKVYEHLQRSGVQADVLARLNRLIEDRTEPLYADQLDVVDPWFAGASPVLLDRLLDRLCSGAFDIMTLNGRPVVSRIPKERWASLRSEALDLARSRLGERPTVDALRAEVRALASAAGASELGDALYRSVAERLHWGPSDHGDVLVAAGKSAREVVLSVLEGLESPAHLDEIVRLTQERVRALAPGTVHRYAQEVGLRFGHGVFGRPKHISIPQNDQRVLADMAKEIIAQGPPGRQWHASDLVDELVGVVDDLDKYLLNAVLENSPGLARLGRMTWGLKGTVEERVQIRDACEVALRSAGGPMSAAALREAVDAVRGTGHGEVFFPSETMVRVSPRHWGLVDRDTYLSPSEREELFDALVRVLTVRGRGLHQSELRAVVDVDSLPESVTDYLIFNLAPLDPRLDVASGQILHLTEWGEPRRHSLASAVREVALGLTAPITTDDIVPQIEGLVDRIIDARQLPGVLGRYLRFDPERRVWNRDEKAGGGGDEDE